MEVLESNRKFRDDDSSRGQVEGRNSVLELLDSNRDINKIFVEKGEKHGSINKILAKKKNRKIVIIDVDK